jgi:isoleucyl-tRNA synthetase
LGEIISSVHPPAIGADLFLRTKFELLSDSILIEKNPAKELCWILASLQNVNFIILNTELTKELINEGLAREMISKVQNLRKEKDFNVIDRINIYYSSDSEIKEMILKQLEFIKNETLAISIINKEVTQLLDINGHAVYLDIEKVL